VQRVLVHRDVSDEFTDALVAEVGKLTTGDPTADGVQVGPVINDVAAERITEWVDEARAAGASVLTGGTREGRTVAPTVLAGVPADAKVTTEEIFGPVLSVAPFGDIDEAFAMVNDSRFGLQAGVFTKDIGVAFRAHRDLEVGGVIIGDVPSFRADQMPYGGWKESGVGREGLRSAMADLTEERTMVLTGLDL
jgi:acyl-CoA reductase-like NAD-dependent aldehyde dehydrogenase